jgi:hypothetical protein
MQMRKKSERRIKLKKVDLLIYALSLAIDSTAANADRLLS